MKKFLFFVGLFSSYLSQAQVIELSSNQLDFGTVVYQNPSVQLITLTNLSDQEVQLEEFVFFDVYESIPFEVVNPPASIPANGSVSVEIRFDPLHNIDHNSELVIKTSGGRGSVYLDLRGSCVYDDEYYEDTQNQMDSDLREVFMDILSEGQIERSYNSARDEMYMVVDNQRLNGQGSSQNRLTRAYLGTDAVGYTSRQDLQNNYGMTAEHTFPQSDFDSELPMQSDVHHLFPADGGANETRSNLRFGNVVSGVTWSQGGSQRGLNSSGQLVFEPRTDQKGFTARAILYFLSRYINFEGFVTAEMEEVIREWHLQFPPGEIDRRRNEDIFDYQGNRNPLTDYPQFVHRIFSFRTSQDRPNVGELVVVDEEANYGFVEDNPAIYNVVLTNVGERFFNLSSIEVSGEGFTLADGQNDAFVISADESKSIKVQFDPNAANGSAEGVLTFNTNLASAPTVTIPLSAETVLGVKDLTDLGITLFPNPAHGQFHLGGKSAEIDHLALVDMSGRIVREFPSGQSIYSLDHLETGLYLVEVLMNDGAIGLQKLMVQN